MSQQKTSEGATAYQRYRASWCIPTTGVTGHGNWSSNLAFIEWWVGLMNLTYSDMRHWIQAESSSAEPANKPTD